MRTIRPLPVRDENRAAVEYVGTTPAEGLAQLEILKRLGCKPHHRVLEIGCGALIAGYPIIQYLESGGYYGIDPNEWLVKASLPIVLTMRSEASFQFRGDFRAGVMAGADFILSHSVLSHVSNSQLTEFLHAVKDEMAPTGMTVSSLRFAEGNAFNSKGSDFHGAHFAEWQYPGVSWFRRDDVRQRAADVGLSMRVVPEFTELLKGANSHAVHDWIVLTPKGE